LTARHGFTRRQRLLKPQEFKRVFESPLRSGDRCLLVIAAPNQQENARLGLSVTRKQLPTAVSRNRIKRLAREGFRANLQKLAGLDVVITCRRPIGEWSNRTILNSLNRHFSRIASCVR